MRRAKPFASIFFSAAAFVVAAIWGSRIALLSSNRKSLTATMASVRAFGTYTVSPTV